MDGIKKKLSNLKLQVDEAADRAEVAEREKRELQAQVDEVRLLIW